MKKYVYRLITIVLIGLLFPMVWNYTFDTSGLFDRDFSKKRVEPNQHFVKMRYILSEPHKYNAFCFGSSRVDSIDLEKINNGLRYYNMTYSVGLPAEWLEDLRLFIEHNVEVRQVIIGLDEFSFRSDPESHKTDWLRLPYKEHGLLETYLSYLMRSPKFSADVPEDKLCYFDIYNTGRAIHPWVDEAIEANPEKHLEKMSKLKQDPVSGDRIHKTIAELKELKNLCDENGIELIVLINPINAIRYRANNINELNEFKYLLVQITDYYDFSGINEVTSDNFNYYELSHYRPIVGDKIVDRIFHGGSDDFGYYVTKKNVEGHLADLRKQVE